MPFDFLALRKAFSGAHIANNDYTRDLAIDSSDLVERLPENAPLNVPKKDSFYGGGSEGNTDYPTLDEAAEAGQS